ncbi:M20/M25/M40 family metallo-hydrolase [Celeribacter sp.]|uniref:M20/M25/M40 family metallo-hydrolase n=1 Tax=Celeribacter sp. TaxID=1890673 RepID=UPI003A901098
MGEASKDLLRLARNLIAFDSRSAVSNREIADFLQSELIGFEIERLDFTDAAGVAKSSLVARRGKGGQGGLAFSGHMDTVPPAGWNRDPFAARVEGERLYGLGSADMKGPIAAFITAARDLPEDVPVMLLLSCDEETTKAGARHIVAESHVLKAQNPDLILVAEPTELTCVRGHRVDIQFIAETVGIQAHSSLPHGRNANLDLIPFLADMRALHLKLRTERASQDVAYTPPWCDLSIVVNNHGAAPNITVGKATCHMKFRYSKAIDPAWVVEAVERSAKAHGVTLEVRPEGHAPELAADHIYVRELEKLSGKPARVAGFGSDASQFSAVAPCLLFGPGSMAQAHQPDEFISLFALQDSVSLYRQLASRFATRK